MKKNTLLFMLLIAAISLLGCAQEGETVEVTRVVPVEVTRVVTETVEVEATRIVEVPVAPVDLRPVEKRLAQLEVSLQTLRAQNENFNLEELQGRLEVIQTDLESFRGEVDPDLSGLQGAIADLEGELRSFVQMAGVELAEDEEAAEEAVEAEDEVGLEEEAEAAEAEAETENDKSLVLAEDAAIDDDPFVGVSRDEFFFEMSGDIREEIEPENVDYAHGAFTGPYGPISQVIGVPGKYNAGPQTPEEIVNGSRGAIQYRDPGNTWRMMGETTPLGCPEGGEAYFSVQQAIVEGPDYEFRFRAPDGSGTHVYVKCPFADGQTGSDAGAQLDISGYRPGYGLIELYSPQPNGGFVDFGAFLQALKISVEFWSCGGEGCLGTYVITFDMNSRALTVAFWNGAEFELVYTNWWNDQLETHEVPASQYADFMDGIYAEYLHPAED